MITKYKVRITLTLAVDDPIGVNVADCVAAILEDEVIATEGEKETVVTSVIDWGEDVSYT